jgi:hypothetical protein
LESVQRRERASATDPGETNENIHAYDRRGRVAGDRVRSVVSRAHPEARGRRGGPPQRTLGADKNAKAQLNLKLAEQEIEARR